MRILLGSFALLSSAVSLQAASLDEVLEQAYHANKQLKRSVASTEAVHEGVPSARAGYLPTVSFSASAGVQRQDVGTFDDSLSPQNYALSFSQPLFRGGRTIAQLDAAKAQVRAAHAGHDSAVQNVLLSVVVAYVDIVRAEELARLSAHNARVIAKHKEATTIRFELGETTITDVAQSESRLARAESELVQAKGALANAKESYLRIVQQAVPAELTMPDLPDALPASLEEAQRLAAKKHPLLQQRVANMEAAEGNTKQAKGQLWPTVSLDGSVSHQKDSSFFVTDDSDTQQIAVNLQLPLYQAGAAYSAVRRAKAEEKAAMYAEQDAAEDIRASVAQSWHDLHTAKATILASAANVKAAKLALDGVSQEQEVGTRTVLDVLDAEQELFTANINEITATRNHIIAAYNLLANIGLLTPSALGLENTLENAYDRVDGKLFGF